MKMIFDGTQITCNDAKQVREDMKEFKSRYTDGDLVNKAWTQLHEKYEELTGERYPCADDVLRANVIAFAHNWEGTRFRVELILYHLDKIFEISYYTDMDFYIDTIGHWNPFDLRYDYMFNVRTFKLEGALISTITNEGVKYAV